MKKQYKVNDYVFVNSLSFGGFKGLGIVKSKVTNIGYSICVPNHYPIELFYTHDEISDPPWYVNTPLWKLLNEKN